MTKISEILDENQKSGCDRTHFEPKKLPAHAIKESFCSHSNQLS